MWIVFGLESEREDKVAFLLSSLSGKVDSDEVPSSLVSHEFFKQLNGSRQQIRTVRQHAVRQFNRISRWRRAVTGYDHFHIICKLAEPISGQLIVPGALCAQGIGSKFGQFVHQRLVNVLSSAIRRA